MKIFLLALIGFLTEFFFFLFGNLDANLKYLIAVVILDYITGLCRAVTKKKVNSSIGIKGIFKKFCYFVIVALSVILGNILEIGYAIRNLTIYSLICNECISVLENCADMGIKLPKIIISALEIVDNKLTMETENYVNKDNEKTKD